VTIPTTSTIHVPGTVPGTVDGMRGATDEKEPAKEEGMAKGTPGGTACEMWGAKRAATEEGMLGAKVEGIPNRVHTAGASHEEHVAKARSGHDGGVRTKPGPADVRRATSVTSSMTLCATTAPSVLPLALVDYAESARHHRLFRTFAPTVATV
jgi:hypothetical protein